MRHSKSQLSTLATQTRPLSPSQLRVKVKAGDKWLLTGITGCGKTTFSKKLLAHLMRLYPESRVYVLDSKMTGDYDNFPGVIQTDGESPGKPDSNQRVQVWQHVLTIPEQIEEWLYMVRRDPPAILNIDEIAYLVYGRNNMSLEYSRLQKLGRALPVMVISQTQELTQIPRNAIGQATHIARFTLQMPYEQQLTNMLLRTKVEEPPDEFGFYYGPNKGNPLYFADYKDFFRG